ncbi:hypothetical protein BC830DRAFT_124845 [Chytriomyces sp. MP71]|nr:hypothetical protein BC830DRAFT_124845 [Chytriomyces sp. MP71]
MESVPKTMYPPSPLPSPPQPRLPLEIWTQILVASSESLAGLSMLSSLSGATRASTWVPSVKASVLWHRYGKCRAISHDSIKEFWHLPDAACILRILISWGCPTCDCGYLNRCPLFLASFQFRRNKPQSVFDDIPLWTPELSRILLSTGACSHFEGCVLVAARDKDSRILRALATECMDAELLLKALRQACRFGFAENVEFLTSRLGEVSHLEESNFESEGLSLLRSATLGGNWEVAERLLKHGALVDAKLVQDAIKSGNSKLVDVMMASRDYEIAGAAPKLLFSQAGTLRLSLPAICVHMAVLKNLPIATIETLVTYCAEPLSPATLELAVSRRDEQLVRILLRAGNLSAVSTTSMPQFWEIFSMAAWDNELRIMELLLQDAGVHIGHDAVESFLTDHPEILDTFVSRLHKMGREKEVGHALSFHFPSAFS